MNKIPNYRLRFVVRTCIEKVAGGLALQGFQSFLGDKKPVYGGQKTRFSGFLGDKKPVLFAFGGQKTRMHFGAILWKRKEN